MKFHQKSKAAAEGLDSDGGLNYEDTVIDREKHWWVQAEAVVDLSLYQNIRIPPIWISFRLGYTDHLLIRQMENGTGVLNQMVCPI